jgi:hypothetical protein
MNVYIDTEFNGYRGALISMALIDADGREFYAALPLQDPPDPWVAQHVLPVLDLQPITSEDFRQMLEWWPDDIRYFCEALITGPGTRINTPPLTLEIRRDLDTVSDRPHNALADARAIRRKAMNLPPWERTHPQTPPALMHPKRGPLRDDDFDWKGV